MTIDPVDFGQLKGTVSALERQATELSTRQIAIEGKIDKILTSLNEVRGGWKMLSLVYSGFAAMIGAGISWLMHPRGMS